MAKLFSDILADGIRQGKIPARDRDAREWFRTQAKEEKRVQDSALMRGGNERLVNNFQIGSMYMYFYDAKHKEKLPYFDRFPLVFPFQSLKGGFRGLNFHYLPHRERAALMDALYEIRNNSRYDESTRIKMSYKVLSGSSKFRGFKPCVKHYLRSQMRSRFLYIYPSEWDIALFLPSERFQGATKRKVWADSKGML